MSYPNIDNIKPTIWGAPAWQFLHSIALAYPTLPTNEERQAAKQLFQSLTKLLPCGSCKVNLEKELASNPIDWSTSSKQSLSKWVTELHNRVNARLGKKSLSVEDVLELIKGPKALRNNKPLVETTVPVVPDASAASAASAAPDAEQNNNDNPVQAPPNASQIFWPVVGSLVGVSFVLLIWAIVVSTKYGATQRSSRSRRGRDF